MTQEKNAIRVGFQIYFVSEMSTDQLIFAFENLVQREVASNKSGLIMF